jgi:hypothetical protein
MGKTFKFKIVDDNMSFEENKKEQDLKRKRERKRKYEQTRDCPEMNLERIAK